MNKNFFSVIGMIAMIAVIGYLALYLPIKAYGEMEKELRICKKNYEEKCEEIDKIYDNFYKAIDDHVDYQTLEEIYNDTNYFESNKDLKEKHFNSEIKSNSYQSYRALR